MSADRTLYNITCKSPNFSRLGRDYSYYSVFLFYFFSPLQEEITLSGTGTITLSNLLKKIS